MMKSRFSRHISGVISWPSTPPAVRDAAGSIGRRSAAWALGRGGMMRPTRQAAEMKTAALKKMKRPFIS